MLRNIKMINKDFEKNLGQLIMMGISSTSLSRDEKSFVKKIGVGGVILFKRNYENLEQLVELTNKIKGSLKSKTPFIGVDQEGGTVIRFGEPFTQFPGNDFLGRYYEKTNSVELVKAYAKVTSRELKGAGINLCFAPVLDVLTNPKNKVIGKRAFSDNVEIVSKLGLEVIKEFMNNGVIPCAKHFPGHGDTLLDSHKTLPEVDNDLELIRERELIPFKKAVDANVSMIMTAHVKYSSLDSEYPATLSKRIIDGLLRKELGYENVVISDDFEMKGIEESWEPAAAAILAIGAGVDLILICHSLNKVETVYERIIKEARENDRFKQKIIESLARIKKIKKSYGVTSEKIDLAVAWKVFNKQSSLKLVGEIARYS